MSTTPPPIKPRGPIPVRFKPPVQDRLARAAKRSGLTSAQIIRLGVNQVLPQIESGELRLPKIA